MAVKPIWHSQKLKLANKFNALHIGGRGLAITVERKSMGYGRSLLAAPCLMLLAACGSASGSANETNTSAPVTGNAVSATPVPTTTDPTAFKLGINLTDQAYWAGARAFQNLILGSGWQMQGPGVTTDVPASSLDANGWVKSLPPGYNVLRMLSVPVQSGGTFVCKYQGNGTLNVDGPVSNVSYAPGETRFTLNNALPSTSWALIKYNVDPANYIRNIDCRETNASGDSFDPAYLNNLAGFKVLRFLKWNKAEANPPSITWATRNKPGDGSYDGNDGVPVEEEVKLATQTGASPWFAIPWNADNDYITRFATYVRDNLPADRQVYVEVSNEVWNGVYPVFAQAQREGIAEGLDPSNGPFGQGMYRYAERTKEVMQIWSTVFSGQMSRLVRVAATQNTNPYWSEQILGYKDTAQYVDALATAPYFGHDADNWTAGQSLDSIMNTILPAKVDETLNFAAQNKAIAMKFGKRYIAYEAGQHIILANNIPLLTQIERDPRMYDLYKSFISAWQSKIGDTLTMFALNGGIGGVGAWGVQEYQGQPISETPKMRAIRDFLGVATSSSLPTDTGGTTTTTSPPPVLTASTQVCPDGSVIDATATCPTTTTIPTSGGKKKGIGNGGGKGRTAVV